MSAFHHLLVLWSDPVTKRRHVVGQLWRTADDGYAFAYDTDIEGALQAGFSLLPEFPAHRTLSDPYRSPTLFSTFAQRIPSSRRPDYFDILKSWGVEHTEDPMEILALSGGVQLTDRLELAEFRATDDDLTRPLQFRVAGEQFYSGAAALSQGDHVELRRERDNAHDARATQVRVVAGDVVGYVPRQYASIVARVLDSGRELDAVAVRRLILPQDRDRWVIRVQAKDRGTPALREHAA